MLSSLPLLFPSFGHENPSWGTFSWGSQLPLDLCPLFHSEWGCFGKGRGGIKTEFRFLTVFLAKWMKEGRTFRGPKWFLPKWSQALRRACVLVSTRESSMWAMQWVCAWWTSGLFSFFFSFSFCPHSVTFRVTPGSALRNHCYRCSGDTMDARDWTCVTTPDLLSIFYYPSLVGKVTGIGPEQEYSGLTASFANSQLGFGPPSPAKSDPLV